MNLLSEKLNIATVSSRRIGEFRFDLTKSESHTSKLNITENPIETGASIADHAFLAPKEVTVTGLMVHYEPPADLSSILPDVIPDSIPVPLPVNIQAVTAQAIATAKQVFSFVEQITDDVDRIIAPFLPNFSETGSDTSPAVGRIRQAYSNLLQIQKSGELTEVMTGIELYKDMAITGITLIQTDDGSAEFTITLREVFIVSTQTVAGLTTGRTKNQSSQVSKKGKTQPESFVSKIAGLFKK